MTLRQHETILELIAEHDPEAARTAMQAHLDGVARSGAEHPHGSESRRERQRVTLLRRLDHVAVLVRDTDEALRFYSGRLGLAVASSEEIPSPHVRLTYLDAGNAYIQLVQPLTGTLRSPLARRAR